VVIKHTIPCGAAIGKTAADAYVKAYKADELSSFGGIIAFNVPVDKKAAKAVCESGFREVVVAPKFDKEALALFAEKKNLRVIEMDISKIKAGRDIKKTAFGYLVQDEDLADVAAKDLKVVTKKKPTAKQMQDLAFAWKLCKHVKSNAIVVAKDQAVLGVGGGFTARVDAGEYAYAKAQKSTKGAVVGSDAFFPYPDNVEIAAKAGVSAIIQPGGSVKDPEVIAACDKHGIAMVFTGMRHFKH
jgi:phosphoribosylaminoimidazolecarboxamide formyltransferase/IMP cyclohydrolase